jgi:hypothetical protein
MIKKYQGIEGDSLGVDCHIALIGQPAQKCSDLRRTDIFWVAFAIEVNKSANPGQVGLFRSDAVST